MSIDWKARDKQQAEERAQLADLAPAICAELGDGWSVAPHKNQDDSIALPTWYSLVGPDDAELHISGGNYRSNGKVHITVSFHDVLNGHTFWYKPYKYTSPSANVAASRGAKVIANEIRRRILPDYLPQLKACNEARAQHIGTVGSAQGFADELAKFIGAQVREPSVVGRTNNTERTIDVYRSESLSGATFDLKVSGACTGRAASVSFDRLDVPPHVAKQILAVLVQNHTNPDEEA